MGPLIPVLVIDGEVVVRNLMCEILRCDGYDAIGADSAQDAMSHLDNPELALVVSDIVMPGLSGFELLDEVHARRPSLPVLLVTGSGAEGHLQEALAHGAAGLIMKPFSRRKLRETVAEVVSRAQSGEQEVRRRVCWAGARSSAQRAAPVPAPSADTAPAPMRVS